jgi:hypothetical protein
MPAGGSSHELRVLKDKNGKRWFSKSSAGDDLQLVNEYLAYQVYKAFGVPVAPEAMLVTDDAGDTRIVTSQAKGKQVTNPKKELAGTDFAKGMFVDALLGSWDVVGNAPRYNLFFDPDTKEVTRIDTGGFDFRAMGGRKGKMFGDKVNELASFAGINGPKMSGSVAADVFGGMSKEELSQAAEEFGKTKWSKVEAAFDKVQNDVDALDDKALSASTRDYLRKMKTTLKSRHEDSVSVINDKGFAKIKPEGGLVGSEDAEKPSDKAGSEAGDGGKSKVDYWRTVQGQNIGFTGDPDKGTPVTGGAAIKAILAKQGK